MIGFAIFIFILLLVIAPELIILTLLLGFVAVCLGIIAVVYIVELIVSIFTRNAPSVSNKMFEWIKTLK